MLDVGRWHNLGGMLSDREGVYLYNTVVALPAPARIIEVGSYQGKSTIAMLQACKDTANSAAIKKVTSVDDFSGDGMTPGESTPASRQDGVRVIRAVTEEWGLRDWLQDIMAMPSQDFFHIFNTIPHGITSEAWLALRPKVDMFFIDGCHACVKEDMLAAWPLLRGGGVMICHDYHRVNPGFRWISDLIDSTGIPGAPVEDTPSEDMLLWKAIKP